MKKLFAIAAALFCMMGVSFADEAADLLKPKEDTLTRTIVPADQHVTNKTASVKIEYTPYTDEAIIYYTVMAVSFDQGEAMNTCLECLQDFQVQNGYYKYTFLRKDKSSIYKDENNIKWALYREFVKFIR
ncbi:MAG: hypothetical protein II921_08075 [Treponema sp.]|nr:hypothetical protein [Treponema sp.]